jgi:hypothetical protein
VTGGRNAEVVHRRYEGHYSFLKFSNLFLLLFVLLGLAGIFYVLTGAGLSGLSTLFENVQIKSATCERVYREDTYFWRINIMIQNTGATQVRIANILVDEFKISFNLNDPSVGEVCTNIPDNGTILNTNDTKSIFVFIGYKYNDKQPLDRVRIKIQTDLGKDYSTVLTLT